MNMTYNFIRRALLVAAFCQLLAVNANAGEKPEWRDWSMGNSFGVGVGAFFANLDTQVRIGQEDLGNTTISFERDIGLEDSEARPLVDAYWRFAKRHVISIQYFKLDRSSETILPIDIKIDGEVFKGETSLQAFFDVENTSVSYNYSFIFTEKHDLYAGLGLSWQNYKTGFKGAADINGGQDSKEKTYKAGAPLPVFEAGYNWAFSPKWIWKNKIGAFGLGFDLENDGKFEGSIYTGTTGLEWLAFKHVSFGASYDIFQVDVDINGSNWGLGGSVKYKYHGPKLYAWLRF